MATSELPNLLSSLALNGPSSDRTIVVAVDFGTTYSGLAWAQTRRPDIQTTITQWPVAGSPGLEGRTSDKVPTEIRYNGDEIQWGFQISDDFPRHQWFKLDLDTTSRAGTSDLARRFPARAALPPGYNANVKQLVTDYLTALRQHTEEFLKVKLPEAALRSTAIEYIITTPAVWSPAAQITTRECAEKAGMGRGDLLQIISEPEAAATYALDVMNPHDIKVGHTFVLCDAGGGTVDLISYTVSGLMPSLRVKEAAAGTGGLCGSTYLNRIFEQLLIAKFGQNKGWDDDVIEEASKRFEELVKRRFTGEISESFQIPVPGLVDNTDQGVRRGKFTLTGAEIVRIFSPVLDEIIALVNGQIQSTKREVKAVLLVGGFGESAYLRASLRKAVGSRIEILVPPNSWTAVVRGALMKGLAKAAPRLERVKILSRSARKHYGLEISTTFNAALGHHESRKSWYSYTGQYQIDAMSWFIKKGDPVKEDTPTRFKYYTASLVASGPPSQIDVAVQVCEDPKSEGAPLYRDSGVKDLVRLRIDLSCIPEETIDRSFGQDGKNYYRCDYRVEMTSYSASTKYELIYKGIRYDSVEAEYV